MCVSGKKANRSVFTEPNLRAYVDISVATVDTTKDKKLKWFYTI